jgi:hypothetical protein
MDVAARNTGHAVGLTQVCSCRKPPTSITAVGESTTEQTYSEHVLDYLKVLKRWDSNLKLRGSGLPQSSSSNKQD